MTKEHEISVPAGSRPVDSSKNGVSSRRPCPKGLERLYEKPPKDPDLAAIWRAYYGRKPSDNPLDRIAHTLFPSLTEEDAKKQWEEEFAKPKKTTSRSVRR